MKTTNKRIKNSINEHLTNYLKSSYLDRLNWLEEANKFVKNTKNKFKNLPKKIKKI